MITSSSLESLGSIGRRRVRPTGDQRRRRVAPLVSQLATGRGIHQVDRQCECNGECDLSIEEIIAAYVASQPSQLYRGGA
ncbi:hypothetical protein [Thiococcus pfennigii]|jgi:hypothetical protein|uniref:hypothetical protein n=1 Tax=Thiococcus pfennigii TaxID=1057 RepID=UPI001903C663|nr:hypothetical protein [Thiococcus pfennigii]MBK1701443.1 hypothetical protein [Thiococcus pfennigii]MBK1730849.1 hypothetical protein [Thiococcus pfennigii]